MTFFSKTHCCALILLISFVINLIFNSSIKDVPSTLNKIILVDEEKHSTVKMGWNEWNEFLFEVLSITKYEYVRISTANIFYWEGIDNFFWELQNIKELKQNHIGFIICIDKECIEFCIKRKYYCFYPDAEVREMHSRQSDDKEIKCGSAIFNKYLGHLKFYIPYKLLSDANITVWFTDMDVTVRNMSFLSLHNISIKEWDIVFQSNKPKRGDNYHAQMNIGCVWYNPTNITKTFLFDMYNTFAITSLDDIIFDQDIAIHWLQLNQYRKAPNNADYSRFWHHHEVPIMKKFAVHGIEGIQSYHIFSYFHNDGAIKSLDILQNEQFNYIHIVHWAGLHGSIYGLWYAKVAGFYHSKYYYDRKYYDDNKIIKVYKNDTITIDHLRETFYGYLKIAYQCNKRLILPKFVEVDTYYRFLPIRHVVNLTMFHIIDYVVEFNYWDHWNNVNNAHRQEDRTVVHSVDDIECLKSDYGIPFDIGKVNGTQLICYPHCKNHGWFGHSPPDPIEA
eukprot:535995_1